MSWTVIGDRALAGVSNFEQGFKREYTRIIALKSSEILVNARQAAEACGVSMLDAYSFAGYTDTGVLARKFYTRQTGPWTWEVTIQYSTEDRDGKGGRGSGQHVENPLLRPAKRNWGSLEYSRVVEKDIDGNPVVNKAKQKFDPPLEEEVSIMVLTVERNEAYFDHGLAWALSNRVNSATFYGADPRHVKSKAPRGQEIWEGELNYWTITYEFHFHPEGWDPEVLNAGSYYIDANGKKRLPEDDVTGAQHTAPILLDTNGNKLAAGGTPIYLKFETLREYDFNVLGL